MTDNNAQGECRMTDNVIDLTKHFTECGRLFGESAVMHELFATIKELAPQPVGVLLQGETGTGKELAAHAIHQFSTRNDQPFVLLDCSALPMSKSLADAAIFGFRRGAFPGGDHDYPGLLAAATGGTLFIDYVDELPAAFQLKLLHALELPSPRKVDVRLVAATNRNLRGAVSAGRFREDLFHRIAQTTLHLPPLRKRGVDILRLAERFVADFVAEVGLPVILAEDARTTIANYGWPGNVRELRKVIRVAAYMCRDNTIRARDLDQVLLPELAMDLKEADQETK